MNERNDENEAMTSGLGVAERELLMRGLHSLPDTPPPRAVWERIAAQAEAEGLVTEPRRAARPPFLAGLGIVAAVLLAVGWLPRTAPPGAEDPFPTEPAFVAGEQGTSLEALRVRSAMLERSLRALPAEPRVVRAGTAATLGELEDRIAAIDYALTDPDDSLTDEERRRYWRERVRLMDSLVQLRYAQARRSAL